MSLSTSESTGLSVFGAGSSKLCGDYKAIGPEKTGGMGAVLFPATDEAGNVWFIKKIVYSNIQDEADRKEFTSRFESEIAFLEQIEWENGHPNIVQYHGFIREPESLSAVLEYIEGPTLKDFVEQKGSLNEKDTIKIAKHLLSASSFLHKKNIIHLDLKPSNTLLKNPGLEYVIAKIIDFGASKALKPNPDDKTVNFGSEGYATLTQMAGLVDKRDDIYAIGAIMFYMLIGQEPDRNPGLFREQLDNIYKIRPGLDKNLGNIIFKATELERKKRYSNVDEMLVDFYKLEKNHVKKGYNLGEVVYNVMGWSRVAGLALCGVCMFLLPLGMQEMENAKNKPAISARYDSSKKNAKSSDPLQAANEFTQGENKYDLIAVSQKDRIKFYNQLISYGKFPATQWNNWVEFEVDGNVIHANAYQGKAAPDNIDAKVIQVSVSEYLWTEKYKSSAKDFKLRIKGKDDNFFQAIVLDGESNWNVEYFFIDYIGTDDAKNPFAGADYATRNMNGIRPPSEGREFDSCMFVADHSKEYISNFGKSDDDKKFEKELVEKYQRIISAGSKILGKGLLSKK